MKNLIILTICLFAIASVVNAQCSKKIIWTGSKAEFLDMNGAIEKTSEEKIVVVSSKTEIKLMHNDQEDDALSGIINDFSCNWTEAFKNGKSVLKSSLAEGNNPARNGVITIEGKDGKITILVALDDHQGKLIKLYIDSCKEVE